jgi:hypothetical protein
MRIGVDPGLHASAIVAALLDDGPEGCWCEEELPLGELVAPHLLPIEAANIVRRTEAHKAVNRWRPRQPCVISAGS